MKDYKKTDNKTIEDIAKDDKKVATELEIDDRMYCTTKHETFITLKDHKRQFMNNPKFRVINPTKSELGKISKQMLTDIISAVKTKSHLVQWKNSDATIDWFVKLENKSNLRFLQFDVVDFYASITPQLLENSLTFAASYTPINQLTRDTVLQACALVLQHLGNWILSGRKFAKYLNKITLKLRQKQIQRLSIFWI